MRIAPHDLTPASGRQDHTTSPSASVPFVKGTSASTASHRAFRDDREPPLLSGETGGLKSLICPTAKAEYFPQRGLTRGVRKRASDLPVGQSGRKDIRHCEPTGRANARPMTGFTKQSISPRKEGMDCFVASASLSYGGQVAPRNDGVPGREPIHSERSADSALVRIPDSSRTSREGRKVPKTEMRCRKLSVSHIDLVG
jgi:hypothetical protein